MKSLRRRIESKLGSIAFRRLQRWVLKKDAEGADRFGKKIGRLAFRVSLKHRRRALSNLAMAFPEKTESERTRIAIATFEHFGSALADFLRCGLRTNEELLANTTTDGYEHILEALKLGKGVLLITAHFGNWERAGHWLIAKGHPMSVVARDANDSDLNDLVQELRESGGMDVISRGDAARPILKGLRQNRIVAILPDQNSGETFVPFFGKPAGTVQGPAVLHLRSGAPLIPAYCVVLAPGKLHLIVRPPIEPDPAYDDPVDGLMAAINRSLEDAVRLHPEQYLWFHDRWKSARRKGLL